MAISVLVKRGAGDRQAPPVRDSMIVVEAMAIARARSDLDRGWYIVKRRDLRVPHDPTIDEGQDAYVYSARLGIAGAQRITAVTVSFEPGGAWDSVTVEEYRAFR